MSMEMNKALDLLREIRPSIPKEVLELWCKDRDAFLASHPAVEQAGGDERAAFEAYRDRRNALLESEGHNPGSRWHVTNAHYPTWEASRAALAQPSPAQAEAEQPEVVARVVHSNPVVLGQCGPLNANDELMTVAQHAASVARWAEMFNRVEQQRDAALARVAELKTMSHNYCALLMDANAKLAELEKQEPINLQHMAVAADGELRWMTGRKIDNCELYAMPDFGQAPKLYAAPVAQAQHSVPIAPELKRALGLVVAALEADGDRPTSKYALSELKNVLAAAPGKEGL